MGMLKTITDKVVKEAQEDGPPKLTKNDIDDSEYKRTYGKSPSRTGNGWAFWYNTSRAGDPIFAPSQMKYAEACKRALQQANETNKKAWDHPQLYSEVHTLIVGT